MEIKTSTIIVTLLGMMFLGSIGLFFMYTGWKDEARAQHQIVTQSLEVLERYWNRGSGGVSIKYDDIEAEGFPAELRIRIVKPRVTIRVGDGYIVIGGNYANLVPDDEEEPTRLYRLEYMQDGYLRYTRGNATQDFFLHLSAKPEIWLRREPSAEGKMPPTFNLYGYQLPQQFSLLVALGDSTAKIPFATAQQQVQPLWQPMLSDIATPSQRLLGMLQRSTKGL